MLLDFGFTSETLNNNLAMLGIAPENLDALILSHGHYDHFGGLAGFLRQNHARLRAGLPLYLGGEECFCTREWTIGKPQDFGALDRKALADAKLKVVFAETPAIVAGHAFTTGHIPVASFEKVLAPTRMTVGVKNGIGCFPDKLSADKRAVTVIPDDFEFGMLPDDWDQFQILMDNALIRVPALEKTGIKTFMNGPESFTPDLNYILGEAPQLKGFFVGAGFNSMGIASSGGAGMALAEWIVAGEPKIVSRVTELEAKVNRHLERMGFAWT